MKDQVEFKKEGGTPTIINRLALQTKQCEIVTAAATSLGYYELVKESHSNQMRLS